MEFIKANIGGIGENNGNDIMGGILGTNDEGKEGEQKNEGIGGVLSNLAGRSQGGGDGLNCGSLLGGICGGEKIKDNAGKVVGDILGINDKGEQKNEGMGGVVSNLMVAEIKDNAGKVVGDILGINDKGEQKNEGIGGVLSNLMG